MDSKHESNRPTNVITNIVARHFDCQVSISASTRLCDEAEFHAIIDSPKVKKLCDDIAEARQEMKQGLMSPAKYEDLKGKKKKALPTFVFGGHSTTGERKAADIQPSGLATLDLDHLKADPREIYDDKIKGHEKELGIAVAHISPSLEGIHIIYELKGGETRAEANERIFTALHLNDDPRVPKGYDKAVKDITRCSFTVPREYFLYIDLDLLFHRAETPQATQTATDQSSPQADNQPSIVSKSSAISPPSTASIQDQMTLEQAEEIFDRACSDMARLNPRGIDIAGHRHNNLIAILSTGICKVVPQALMRQVVASRIPSFRGEADSQALICDFYGKYLDPSAPLSRQLAKIRVDCLGLSSKATAEATEEAAEEAEETREKQQQQLCAEIIKCLPKGLSDTVTGLPDNMKMPVLCTVLPLAAAYADGVSAEYRDGSIQRLGLMSAIVGPSASGKGICAKRMEPWLKKIDDISDKASKEEDEYREKCKTRKANEKAPQDPHVFKPKIPFTISLTQLLNRAKNAQGHTLFSFCEELAAVANTNNRGEWSNKRAAYTVAFDGGEFGQDYYSTESVSVSVKLHYNWSVTGTYGAFDQFFKGDTLEGGLASRVLFSEMPDTSFQPIIKYPPLSAKALHRIDAAVKKLCAAKGIVRLPRVCAALDDWSEQKRIAALASNDRAADYFRRRAAVIGFRCAAVVYLLSGKKETENVVRFAELMTEYVFRCQMRLLAKKYRDTTVKASEQQQRNTENGSVFDNLPQQFTRDDLQKQKPGANIHCLTQMVSTWKRAKWIKKVAANTWEKMVDFHSMFANQRGQEVTMSLSR